MLFPPRHEGGLILSKNLIRVGCAGWSIPSRTSYSFDTVGSHLKRYCQVLNCCEINSTFYRPHRKSTWERWAESVPDRFRFSVKAPKTITHEAKLNCDSQILSAFLDQVTLLRGKLGPILFQLPPSLNFEPFATERFLSMLRQSYPGNVTWEPRHESWFNKKADDLLKIYQISRAAADPACVPAGSHPGGVSNLAYYRLHGTPHRYYSAYTAEDLTRLSSKLADLAVTAEVWCIFDNTASGSAIQNATELNARLGQPPLALF